MIKNFERFESPEKESKPEIPKQPGDEEKRSSGELAGERGKGGFYEYFPDDKKKVKDFLKELEKLEKEKEKINKLTKQIEKLKEKLAELKGDPNKNKEKIQRVEKFVRILKEKLEKLTEVE